MHGQPVWRQTVKRLAVICAVVCSSSQCVVCPLYGSIEMVVKNCEKKKKMRRIRTLTDTALAKITFATQAKELSDEVFTKLKTFYTVLR